MRKRGVDGFRALQSEEKGKYQTIMLQITLDMYQTLAAAVVVLALGRFLRGRVRLLERFCIPAPVIGGVLFAIFTCVCYGTGIAEFAFDDILKEVCMVFFFTSVGFQANLKVLRSGGTAMIVFLVLVIGLIVGQNFVAIGLSKVLGISPLVGLCTGSIPMVGGHGTAGAFGPMLEGFGVRGATTLCTAAATYGLIAGSMMGGPARPSSKSMTCSRPWCLRTTACWWRMRSSMSATPVCTPRPRSRSSLPWASAPSFPSCFPSRA